MARGEMNTHRLTDDEVAAVLSGQAQVRSSEAATVARAVTDIRGAFLVTAAPPPSPELAAHLDLDYLAKVSSRPDVSQWDTAAGPSTVEPGGVPSTTPRHRARIRRLVGWLSGLGLAWQVGLGSTAAFAAVTGAGVSGVLPNDVQDLFDTVVAKVSPFDRAAAGIDEPWLVRRNATPTNEAQPFDAPELNEPHAESGAGANGRDGRAPDGERNAVGSNQPSLTDDGASNALERSEETRERHSSPEPTRHPGADDAEEDRLSDSRDAEEEAADRAEDEAGDAEDAAEESADEAEDARGDAEDASEESADAVEDARGGAKDAVEEAAEDAADEDAADEDA